MKKTITITDPMKVKTGDKAYFKDCDFGFTVLKVDRLDATYPILVRDPPIGKPLWARSSQFDHATREAEEPEWPDPHDIKLRVYLGANGKRYIYNPIDKCDASPWVSEGSYLWKSREVMEAHYRDALPLTELKLVPANDDNDEQ